MSKNFKRMIIALFVIIALGITFIGYSIKFRGTTEIKKFGDMSVNVERDTHNRAVETVSQSTALANKDKADKTQPLEGLSICIDAGHGVVTKKINKTEPIAPGESLTKAAAVSGTCGVATKITEESLNLSIAKKLKKALMDMGAEVHMIREQNVCNLTNVERAEIWNKSGADLAIRIHGNGISNSKVSGVLMMVPDRKYINDMDMIEKSKMAGEYILKGVLKQTKAESQGIVKTSELTGFNWSKIPVVLLEVGYMTNPQEDRLLNTSDYQSKIVDGIVYGLEKYNNYLAK